MGRPGLPPGIYFRLLLIGYFEGMDSERGIAWRAPTRWRCATSWASASLTVPRRSFDDLADAPVDRPGDASGGVHVGAAVSGRGRVW